MQNTVKSSTASMTASMGMLKTAIGALGVVMGARAMYNFGKDSVKAASDLQEVQNVVDVAFGSMKQSIEDFAATSITNLACRNWRLNEQDLHIWQWRQVQV